MKIKQMYNFFVFNKQKIKFLHPWFVSKINENYLNFIFIEKKVNSIQEKKYYDKKLNYKKLKNCTTIDHEKLLRDKNYIIKLLKEKNNVLVGYYKSIVWIYRFIQEQGFDIFILK